MSGVLESVESRRGKSKRGDHNENEKDKKKRRTDENNDKGEDGEEMKASLCSATSLLQPSEKHFRSNALPRFCIDELPMGWSWAPYFCQCLRYICCVWVAAPVAGVQCCDWLPETITFRMPYPLHTLCISRCTSCNQSLYQLRIISTDNTRLRLIRRIGGGGKGPIWYNLVQFGTIWHNLVQFGTIWYNLVQFGTIWYNLVQFGTIWYNLVQSGPI